MCQVVVSALMVVAYTEVGRRLAGISPRDGVADLARPMVAAAVAIAVTVAVPMDPPTWIGTIALGALFVAVFSGVLAVIERRLFDDVRQVRAALVSR